MYFFSPAAILCFAIRGGMSWSPPKASSALVITAVLANMTELFAFRAAEGRSALIRVVGGDTRGCREFLPICMDFGVKLFEVLNDSLSCKMTGDIVGDDGELLGVSNSIKDAMSNGSGDSSYYDGVETKNIIVLIS
jgi:hypothetical protein